MDEITIRVAADGDASGEREAAPDIALEIEPVSVSGEVASRAAPPEPQEALSDTLRPGFVMHEFEIVRPLGHGGFGVVYEARWLPYDRRPIALKVLRVEQSLTDDARTRFDREAEAVGAIQNDHIVKVLCQGRHGGRHYIAMELLEGEPLSELIRRGERLSYAEAADLMLPVLWAVNAIHEAGMVHRDLKPSNVFLKRSPQGRVHPVVLDFGIVKIHHTDAPTSNSAGDPITRSDLVMGTPLYMAPELAESARNASPASDQFALGVILYMLATGTRPFQGDNQAQVLTQVVLGNYVAPRRLRDDIPARMDSIIVRAMERQPAQRFPSVWAMGQALLECASPEGRAFWSRKFQPDLEVSVAQVAPERARVVGHSAPPPRRANHREVDRDDRRKALVAWASLTVILCASMLAAIPVPRGGRRGPRNAAPVVQRAATTASATAAPASSAQATVAPAVSARVDERAARPVGVAPPATAPTEARDAPPRGVSASDTVPSHTVVVARGAQERDDTAQESAAAHPRRTGTSRTPPGTVASPTTPPQPPSTDDRVLIF